MKNVPGAVLMFTLLLGTLGLDGESVDAAEPGWSPIIIPTGAYRQEIKSMPIEQRPYRPGHFYGNTVRRRHYRGEVLPRVSDAQVIQNAAPILIGEPTASPYVVAPPASPQNVPIRAVPSNPQSGPNSFGLRRIFSIRN
ncbi:putative secreted protein [Rhodopirellula maiorica SM1]|uniref:Putative secreted protein n=1 Tax=Rhodopirellula maiorica SM1 TaxID=1265738 RepID=M5RQM3_9BACT|nr:hypothetical protein [Rhodopirellula maiorica]EMI21595.1 putative secreted protein [Rhodopirellula maiorica SM1]